MRYGIRITHVEWAAIDGGPDLHGTREQMTSVAERWRQSDAARPGTDRVVLYDVVPYVGSDPADQETVDQFLARG